jgi:hypothetical protein
MYVYHHLGLGDHIICNGMVRHFLEKYKIIYLFCHDHYKNNIEYMYRDESQIIIIPVKHEIEISKFLKSISGSEYIQIGFNDLGKYENGLLSFDEAFYDLAGVDFNIRFSKFFIKRDYDNEISVMEDLNPHEEDYIYVHDDPSRGHSIDPATHRTDLKIIKNDFRYNLFQFRLILENATEIHTMQSGLYDLCNSMSLKKPKIFLHTYVRNYSNFILNAKGINVVDFV